MTPAGFAALQSEPGRAALAAAAALQPGEADFLRAYDRLRKRFEPDLAKAAVEMAILRRKAAAKFPDADRLFFEREALEQATHHIVAEHRVERFRPFQRVLDLGCGLGADAIALARAGCRVIAVERDPLRAAMARANMAALGLNVEVLEADALADELPVADAAFCDPARRGGGRRHLASSFYEPPLAAVIARFPHLPLGFKLAPGISRQEMETQDGEWEFVSLHGELKESRLWCGALATCARRATLLPGGESFTGPAAMAARTIHEESAFLFLPDATITRAGLEEHLAEQLQLSFLNEHDPILLGDARVQSPFVREFRIEIIVRGTVARLNAELRARGIGRVTLMNIGSPRDAAQIERALKPKGDRHAVLLLTRQAGGAAALLLESLADAAATLPNPPRQSI